MALRTPPSWLQNGSHPAENDRLSMQALYATTGIIGTSSLAVTQNGTPNMSVNSATGWAAILGTYQSNMGVYTAYNDATVNAAIATANPTLARIDLVCLTVSDSFYTGSTNTVAVNVVTGTAAASPTVPATPTNSIALAQVAVGAGVTSIVTANITDSRVNVTTNLPVVTLTGTQTLTNKTLTTPVISSISNTGLLTLPTSTDTVVARATTDTLTNKTLSYPIESAFTTATGFAGYQFYLQTNNGVQYITANSTANGTLNLTAASGTTLNSIMATGQSASCVLLVTNGTTAYYPTAYQVDGSAVTPKWAGGTAPSAGNASGIDVYSFTIIKTGSAAFTVLAGQTKFAQEAKMSPLLSGFAFGGSGTTKATITGTTGSPTVDTTTRPGKTIYRFTGSGTFTVDVAGICEMLAIGGGGGGGGNFNTGQVYGMGGGGAGGLIVSTSAGLAATTYTVTIGSAGPENNNGNNTTITAGQIQAYFAQGGGKGGAGSAGGIGGCGGGGYGNNLSGGAAQFGQGFAGGAGAPAVSTYGGGGGGGCGAVGVAATTGGGNGGNGIANSITGVSVTYGGGGGGGSSQTGTPRGTGGTGGGGQGGFQVGSAGQNATVANSGSGGGGAGCADGSVGGAGAAGVVIIVIG